jgi:hypothetical protein
VAGRGESLDHPQHGRLPGSGAREERTRAAVDKAYADRPDEGDAQATEAA